MENISLRTLLSKEKERHKHYLRQQQPSKSMVELYELLNVEKQSCHFRLYVILPPGLQLKGTDSLLKKPDVLGEEKEL